MSALYVIKMRGVEVFVTSNEGEATIKFYDLVKEKRRNSDSATINYLSFKTDKDGNRIKETMDIVMVSL